MSKLTIITDRALELAGHAGDSLRQIAPHAGEWLQTGAAVGAIKTGGKVATRIVRRNPVAAVALVAAGVGVLAWVAWRKHKQKAGTPEGAAIEGQSRRIEARPVRAAARRPRARKATVQE